MITERLKAQIYIHINRLKEWSKGIIEKVSEEVNNNACYLPHRSVVKENSTTKIKPVFDASISGEDPPSLIHYLEADSNLIEQIPRILIRFR